MDFSFVVADLEVGATYGAGDTIYSDDYIDFISYDSGTVYDDARSNFSVIEYDGVEYTKALCWVGDSDCRVTSPTGNTVRVVGSFTAKKACTIYLLITLNAGKTYEVLSDDLETSLELYTNDEDSKIIKTVTIDLAAGQTVYFGGVGTNLYVFALGVNAGNESSGGVL